MHEKTIHSSPPRPSEMKIANAKQISMQTRSTLGQKHAESERASKSSRNKPVNCYVENKPRKKNERAKVKESFETENKRQPKMRST